MTDVTQQMVDAFTMRERPNGDTFYALRDDAPEWADMIVQNVHDGMFPDDWTLGAIYRAAVALTYSGDYDDESQCFDSFADSETDIYTHELFRWLPGNVDAVEEKIHENGFPEQGLTAAIEWAQSERLREIIQTVSNELQNV